MKYIDFLKKLTPKQYEAILAFRRGMSQRMKEMGAPEDIDEKIDDAIGLEPPTSDPFFNSEQAEQLGENFIEIVMYTKDDDIAVIMLRAMAIYRSIVGHMHKGGKILFVGNGSDRILKVPMRKS